VLGVEPRGHSQVIKARIPMSEVLKYAPDLNSMTGRPRLLPHGVLHYDELPGHLVDKVVRASKQHEPEGTA
jgi:elongation factor G